MKKHQCKGCHAEVKSVLVGYCKRCMEHNREIPIGGFWNNRIVIGKDGAASIREVHYAPDGKIESWTKNPKRIIGADAREVIAEILDLSKDVLHCGLNSATGLVLSESELEAAIDAARKEMEK